MRYIQRILETGKSDVEIPFAIKKCDFKDYGKTQATRNIFENNQLNKMEHFCPDFSTYKDVLFISGASTS